MTFGKFINFLYCCTRSISGQELCQDIPNDLEAHVASLDHSTGSQWPHTEARVYEAHHLQTVDCVWADHCMHGCADQCELLAIFS